jgi:hypothetical protein
VSSAATGDETSPRQKSTPKLKGGRLRYAGFHLVERGKTKMQALVATMCKLLHAIYGMFKHDQLFDGEKVYTSSDAVLAPALSNSEVA